MLVTLETPYVDTEAGDLSLALGGPELPALYVLDLELPDRMRLRLRLLGASHQVMLRAPGGVGISETVACLPGRPPELPTTLHDESTGYRFSAMVQRLDPDELSARVGRLRRELADDPYALVGVFPGDLDAVTALEPVRTPVGPGSVGWRTWHVYPQSGEVVRTETVVTLR